VFFSKKNFLLQNQNFEKRKQGLCHIVALPFTFFKSILRQKKNYRNSNISPCKNIIFKKKTLYLKEAKKSFKIL